MRIYRRGKILRVGKRREKTGERSERTLAFSLQSFSSTRGFTLPESLEQARESINVSSLSHVHYMGVSLATCTFLAQISHVFFVPRSAAEDPRKECSFCFRTFFFTLRRVAQWTRSKGTSAIYFPRYQIRFRSVLEFYLFKKRRSLSKFLQ